MQGENVTFRYNSLFAERIFGDAKRWRAIAKLNGLGPEKSYRLGDCLKLPVWG